MRRLLGTALLAAFIGAAVASAGEFTMPGERTRAATAQLSGYVGGAHSPGDVITTALTSCPNGSLEADGSAVSRTKYGKLFAALGTTYGTGNGSTTFTLPDTRGFFLRGWDHAAGNDPDAASRTNRGDGTTGDAVGTKQTTALRTHTHTLSANQLHNSSYLGTAAKNLWNSSTVTSTSAGGTESRGKNVNVIHCIWAGQ